MAISIKGLEESVHLIMAAHETLGPVMACTHSMSHNGHHIQKCKKPNEGTLPLQSP